MTPLGVARVAAGLRSAADTADRRYSLADTATATWFLVNAAAHVTAQVLGHVAHGVVGGDAQSYSNAAHAWLIGGDPWAVQTPWAFAAPPPTLLFFAPTALLPPTLAGGAWIAVDVLAIIATVRILRLAWWWAFWPPIVSAAVAGNPEPVMLLLLVGGGAWIAPAIKPYAIVPLVLLRRWRAVFGAVALIVVSAVVLPWGTFLADFSSVSARLWGNAWLSAWAHPVLVPFVVVALWRLGMRRSAWLAVPLLLPATQFWYAAVALPGAGRWMGVALSVPVPAFSSLAAIAEAAWRTFADHRANRHGRSATAPHIAR